jgi:hypothetical protein
MMTGGASPCTRGCVPCKVGTWCIPAVMILTSLSGASILICSGWSGASVKVLAGPEVDAVGVELSSEAGSRRALKTLRGVGARVADRAGVW